MNRSLLALSVSDQTALIFRKTMIAHDKGKPVARQGRKAVNLFWAR